MKTVMIFGSYQKGELQKKRNNPKCANQQLTQKYFENQMKRPNRTDKKTSIIYDLVLK